MRSVEMIVGSNVLHGLIDEKFEPLLTAFAANFSERDEQGASVCLNVEGETVVDLWGGGHSGYARMVTGRKTASALFTR